jgi:SAM-dependent methyltransferase
MQAYSQGFARIYNTRWVSFANIVAPRILDFYQSTPQGQRGEPVLDLCCGTGQLARHLLDNGLNVLGVDLSDHMLHYARQNTLQYIVSGQAKFIQADASQFRLDERFGLVVSTFDALNHLTDEETLISCFRSVHAVCNGYFIFDLNTRSGLNRWNNVQLDDSGEDAFIITHSFYDGESDKAWVRITGFVLLDNGLYERFDQTAYNTVFELEKVKNALVETGWEEAYFARVQDLTIPLAEPEKEGRVFVVARK